MKVGDYVKIVWYDANDSEGSKEWVATKGLVKSWNIGKVVGIYKDRINLQHYGCELHEDHECSDSEGTVIPRAWINEVIILREIKHGKL